MLGQEHLSPARSPLMFGQVFRPAIIYIYHAVTNAMLRTQATPERKTTFGYHSPVHMTLAAASLKTDLSYATLREQRSGYLAGRV
jgi:hypothetical protein